MGLILPNPPVPTYDRRNLILISPLRLLTPHQRVPPLDKRESLSLESGMRKTLFSPEDTSYIMHPTYAAIPWQSEVLISRKIWEKQTMFFDIFFREREGPILLHENKQLRGWLTFSLHFCVSNPSFSIWCMHPPEGRQKTRWSGEKKDHSLLFPSYLLRKSFLDVPMKS